MSERNRYRVIVCYENIVYADNPAEAEQFGIEECEQGLWQVVGVEVDPAPARDPADDIDRRNGTQ